MANEFECDNSMLLDTEEIKAQKVKSDLISKKLGELLLKGYRMLDANCSTCGCILMQLKNLPTYCVNCEEIEVKKKPEPTSIPVAESKPLIKAEPETVPKLNGVKIKKESDEDEAAQKISELLLKGYKMLNATCDQCDTILMQKRKEEPMCVLCVDRPKQNIQVQSRQTQEDFEEKPKKIFENKGEVPVDIENALIQKLTWATNELKISSNIKQTIELCELIKVASDALSSVKNCFNK